jgi:hypothetical protein
MRRLGSAPLVLLAACAAATPAWTPDTADAVIRPASMVANRETAPPGAVVEITFPDEDFAGIAYALEQEVGSSWLYRYLLLAAEGDGDPTWHEGPVPFQIPGVGIPVPIRVAIPDDAEAGTWRICTVDVPSVCVRLEIEGSGSNGNLPPRRGVSAA